MHVSAIQEHARCGLCVFAVDHGPRPNAGPDRFSADVQLRCHRFPPVGRQLTGQRVVTEHPRVEAETDWCGEYRSRD